MSKDLKTFIASLPQEEQEAIDKKSRQLIAEEMSLQKLRKARTCSQEKVGAMLDINQSAVATAAEVSGKSINQWATEKLSQAAHVL